MQKCKIHLFVASILTKIDVAITAINLGTVCYLNKIAHTLIFVGFFVCLLLVQNLLPNSLGTLLESAKGME